MTKHPAPALLLPLLLGCVHGPPEAPDLRLELSDGYGSRESTRPEGDYAGERWWEGFADAGLDRLVEEALAANHDVAAAAARVRAADALVRGARGAGRPSLDATGGFTRRRQNFIGFPIPGGEEEVLSSTTGVLDAGLAASWEPDLWGRIASGTHAAAADRRSLATLEGMRVRTPEGAGVAFETVADARYGVSYSTIERTDRRRTLHVTAEVDDTLASATEIVSELAEHVLPELVERHPRVAWSFEGEQREQREQRETLRGLLRGFVVALFAIYGLMAVPFRSYTQPLIVMTAIPFGMVGAFLGHLIFGMDMNVLSMCGMIALAGVVVNDNLVLVDYINKRRSAIGARGPGHGEIATAVREAGAARFRPILLTSLTTFAGLTPLMLETSVQALFLIPMAVSLAFGVIFSTSVSLILVPCLYMSLEDVKHKLTRTRQPSQKREA